MSELTTCNYCSLKRIRERAARDGKRVTLRKGNDGIYVHVHDVNTEIDTKNWDDGNKQIISWFMEISKGCVC